MTDSIAEVARIAAGLTKAQRDCLGGMVAHRLYGVTVVQTGYRMTLDALERKGLLEGATFTPLGRRVRSHLMGLEACPPTASRGAGVRLPRLRG